MRRRPILLVVAIVLAIPLTPASAQDEGGISIRLAEAPTDRADDPRAQIYVVDHLQPGDVIERRLEVGNTTAEAVTVDLYAGAATIEGDTFTPLDGRAENPLTEWTTITPPQVTVPSGGAEQAVLRVEVPDDAPGGEQYAVAWAQPPSATNEGVTVVNRVGVRMYVSVGGTEPPTEFTIADISAVTAPDGARSLVVDVDNPGGRAIDVGGELRLTEGPGSTSAGPFEVPTSSTIAPGSSGRLVIPVPSEIPTGPWTAEVALRSGTTQRTATASVTWPDAGSEPLDVEIQDGGDDDNDIPGVVSALAALAALGVAAALGLFVRRSRRLR